MAAIHSDEFKRDAVRIAQTSGLTRRQVASDLGIGHSTLGKWVRTFSEESKVPAQDAELLRENERLRKENRILREEREVLKKAAVVSTGQRNGLSKRISWGPEAKGFAWAIIEAEGDLIKVILTVDGQIRSVGEVLAQQTICVLVAAALPRALRITEVDSDISSDGEFPVIGQFGAPVPGQRGHQPLRQVPHLPDKSVDHGIAVFAINLDQHDKPRRPLNQRGDVRVPSAT